LRREKANQFCGGWQYKDKMEATDVEGAYALWVRKDVSKEALPLKAYHVFVQQILEPLHKAFGFHKDNVRVLYDPCLQHLTAFNQGGLVYLNIGVFQQQHYVKGAISNLESALLSWYHTLAHEFAHNLVPSHNANFELVYSRLCQKYMTTLYTHPALKQAVGKSEVKL